MPAPRGSGVQVMGLTKLIHGREVLSGVSVTVSAGMTVGLSGAGSRLAYIRRDQ